MSTSKVASAATRQIPAVVVSAGLMAKTVKVQVGRQIWNAHIRKNFNRPRRLLVHDPRSSLRQGDIINIAPGWRASKHVHHVVTSITAPFGEPIEARPTVPSEEERLREREEKLGAKKARRAARSLDGTVSKTATATASGVVSGTRGDTR